MCTIYSMLLLFLMLSIKCFPAHVTIYSMLLLFLMLSIKCFPAHVTIYSMLLLFLMLSIKCFPAHVTILLLTFYIVLAFSCMLIFNTFHGNLKYLMYGMQYYDLPIVHCPLQLQKFHHCYLISSALIVF